MLVSMKVVTSFCKVGFIMIYIGSETNVIMIVIVIMIITMIMIVIDY